MTVQFQRAFEVQVDDIIIDKLDVKFKVIKTLKKEPNTCELTIYNLNEQHRAQLAEKGQPVVQIKAGYEDGFGTIFTGDVRDVGSVYEGVDWVTTLASGDGEKATRFDRINKSFAKGTDLSVVLREIAKSMNLGLGNTDSVIRKGKLVEAGSQFLNGVTVSGQSSKQMERIVRSAGLEWSIQDGTLQLLEAGKTLLDTSVVLRPDTGLIGSPTIDNEGVVTITSLMNSDIIPGRQIELESRAIKGRFRAERCEYLGDIKANDWYVRSEAKEIEV